MEDNIKLLKARCRENRVEHRYGKGTQDGNHFLRCPTALNQVYNGMLNAMNKN